MLRSSIVLGLVTLCACAWVVSSATARAAHVGLTITVSGSGRVTGPDLDCPPDCFASIPNGNTIEMTASPDAGLVFSGWGGDCVEAGTNATCALLMNRDRSATAGFGTPPPPPTPTSTLTVRKTGTGTGYVGGAAGIDCGPTCATSLPNGTSVTLIAVADQGSQFTGWAETCSGSAQCTVAVDRDVAVTAVFNHEDTSAPHVSTLPASARHGTSALLRYRAWDDSQESREEVTVYSGKLVLKRIRVATHAVLYRRVYSTRWRVPSTLTPGLRKFCVVAVDEAGNRSRRSCSPLRVT